MGRVLDAIRDIGQLDNTLVLWEIGDNGASMEGTLKGLYDVEHDFSEANDLAKSQPQKLKELEDLFWAEAAKYNVLPLDDRFIKRADPSLRPSLIAGRTAFTYFPGAYRIPESSSPNVKNKVAQHHGLHRHALEGW